MLLVSMTFFSLVAGRLCSGGKHFDLDNVIFPDYFILSGRNTHIYFLQLWIVVGIICPRIQEFFL